MKTAHPIIILGVCVVFGLVLRIWIVGTTPFTNDEGAYLYDARTLTEGRLPAGDVLVKTPITVLMFASSVWLTGGSLFAARAVNILAVFLTVLPLYYLSDLLAGRRAAAITCILWLLSASSTLLLVTGHSQPLSNLLALLAVAGGVHLLQKPTRAKHAFLVGALLALALATRKTNLVVVFPLLAYWLLAGRPQVSLSVIRSLSIGFGAIIMPWLGIVYHWYGLDGMADSLGASPGGIVITHLFQTAAIEPWGGDFVWVMETISRLAPVNGLLVLLALALMMQAISQVVWPVGEKVGWYLTAICASLVALAVPPTPGHSLVQLLWLTGGVILASLAWFRPTRFRLSHGALGFSIVWLLSLAGVYAAWPVFLIEYVADFLPPATLAGGVALAAVLPRRFTLPHIAITIAALSAISFYSAWRAPWTGMFSVEAIKTAATTLVEQVPLEQPVFTGAVIIPYYSGHQALFDIAHPLWYQFSFIDAEEQQRYLPSVDRIETALQTGQVGAVITEHLTDYAYRQRQQGINRILNSQWEEVVTIPNETGFRSNPLRLYVRNK